MVRASISFNKETKSYEWKVTDTKEDYVFEITTPNHNMCMVRNFPQLSVMNNSTLNFYHFSHYKHKKEQNNSLSQSFSLFPFLWFKHEDEVYHPIRNFIVHCTEKTFFSLMKSIEVDILNHVLEFDRQCKRDQLLEHQMLRTQFESDMKSVVQSVPIQATPAKPTHDCTYATTGYCRGWQEGMIMHSCPDLSHLAR